MSDPFTVQENWRRQQLVPVAVVQHALQVGEVDAGGLDLDDPRRPVAAEQGDVVGTVAAYLRRRFDASRQVGAAVQVVEAALTLYR